MNGNPNTARTSWPRVGMALALCLGIMSAGSTARAEEEGASILDRTFETGEGATLWFDSDRGGITVHG